MVALYVIAGLLACGVAVLCIPVDMALELELRRGMRAKVRAGWLFGLVRREIRPRPGRPAEMAKKRVVIRPFLAFIRTAGMPRRLLKLGRQVLRRLHMRRLEGDVRVGLEDPADTGMVCAFAWPALACLNALRPHSIRLEPCFTEPVLEARLRGTMRVYPIEMAGLLLSFVVSPVFLRAIWSAAAAHWRKRR